MPRFAPGPDPRLAVIVANGLDPTRIPTDYCEVSPTRITFKYLVAADSVPLVFTDWIDHERTDV